MPSISFRYNGQNAFYAFATLFDLNSYALYRFLLWGWGRHEAFESELEPLCLIFVELLATHPE